jgi:CheY-like chemotaxis protein
MSKTILIADDDPLNRDVLAGLLRPFEADGVVLLFASDGEKALALARSHQPDLLLLDAEMPGLSGVEVCRAVRADASLGGATVIMLTANVTPDLRRDAEAAGVDAYVLKPFDPADLRAHVADILFEG